MSPGSIHIRDVFISSSVQHTEPGLVSVHDSDCHTTTQSSSVVCSPTPPIVSLGKMLNPINAINVFVYV